MNEINELQNDNLIAESQNIEDVITEEISVDPEAYVTWRNGISNIITGIIFNFFTISILGLHFILPVIGLIKIYIGISKLRHYNNDFEATYKWGMVFVLTKTISIIMGASPLNVGPGGILLSIAIVLINVGFISKLRTSINNVYLEKGVEKKRDPLQQLVMFLIVALIGTATVFVFIPILTILVFIWAITIVVSLINYKNETSGLKVIVENKLIDSSLYKQIALFSVAALLLTMGTMLISMHDFSSGDIRDTLAITNTATKNKLIEDGVESWLVDMLSDEELAQLEGYVDFNVKMQSIGDRKSAIVVEMNYFEMPDGIMYYLQGLKWIRGSTNWKSALTYNNTQLPIIKDYDNNGATRQEIEDFVIISKLMYEKDGVEYERNLENKLKDGQVIFSNSNLMGINMGASHLYEFNFPFNSENNRIFTLTKYKKLSNSYDNNYVDSRLLKNDSPLMYPYKSPATQFEGMGNNFNGKFIYLN